MYVTLYAADNPQIVLDTIKDIKNAKLLFTNHYMLEEDQISVTSEVLTDIPKPVAEDLLSIIEYVHSFYPDSEQAKTELPGCGTGRQHGACTVAPGRLRGNRGYAPVWNRIGRAKHVRPEHGLREHHPPSYRPHV